MGIFLRVGDDLVWEVVCRLDSLILSVGEVLNKSKINNGNNRWSYYLRIKMYFKWKLLFKDVECKFG